MKTIILALIAAFYLISCESKPKVIEAVDVEEETQPILADESANKLHKVVVEEVLHTSRYT